MSSKPSPKPLSLDAAAPAGPSKLASLRVRQRPIKRVPA